MTPPSAWAGSWAPDGSIYFAPRNSSGLSKVSSNGGAPTSVTSLDRAKGEVTHRWPHVLPDGRAVMFTMWTGPGTDELHVVVQRFDTGEAQSSSKGASQAGTSPPGMSWTHAMMSHSPCRSIWRVWRWWAAGASRRCHSAAVARVLISPRRTLESLFIFLAIPNDTSAGWSGWAVMVASNRWRRHHGAITAMRLFRRTVVLPLLTLREGPLSSGFMTSRAPR